MTSMHNKEIYPLVCSKVKNNGSFAMYGEIGVGADRESKSKQTYLSASGTLQSIRTLSVFVDQAAGFNAVVVA